MLHDTPLAGVPGIGRTAGMALACDERADGAKGLFPAAHRRIGIHRQGWAVCPLQFEVRAASHGPTGRKNRTWAPESGSGEGGTTMERGFHPR